MFARLLAAQVVNDVTNQVSNAAWYAVTCETLCRRTSCQRRHWLFIRNIRNDPSLPSFLPPILCSARAV